MFKDLISSAYIRFFIAVLDYTASVDRNIMDALFVTTGITNCYMGLLPDV